jgi:hypothetical protein
MYALGRGRSGTRISSYARKIRAKEMPVRRHLTCEVWIPQLLAICDSLAGHVAARLQHFGSDERTLTDDVADLFWLWAQVPPPPTYQRGPRLTLRIHKESTADETASGADLELVLSTPQGRKRVLAQAKVLDPKNLTLRCQDRTAWETFRIQLKTIREQAGDLGVALLYVPSAELAAGTSALATWEQVVRTWPSGTRPERLGITVIGAGQLIAARICKWCHNGKLTYSHGSFTPEGVSLTRFLLQVLACHRGSWDASRPGGSEASPEFAPRNVLSIAFQTGIGDWQEVQTFVQALLHDFDERQGLTGA